MAWLHQMRSGDGAVLLQDLPAETLRVTCALCARDRTYPVADLVARCGPAAGLPDVLARITAGCARRQDWRQQGPCQAQARELAA